MNACAMTDHGNMYGLYEFWSIARELGIKPIIGCEVYLAKRTRFDKEVGIDNVRYHMTLLAKNQVGYHNLIKIVSLANTEGFYYKPRVDIDLLKKYSEGIIALTGCMSSKTNRFLSDNDLDSAKEHVLLLKSIFKDVYIETFKYGTKESDVLHELHKKLSVELNTPIVATCDTHYLTQDDYIIQEIAWCIGDGKKLADPNRRQFISREFYLKSPEEMTELFNDCPEAVENSSKISNLVEEYSIEFQRIQPIFDRSMTAEQTKLFLSKLVYKLLPDKYPELTDLLKTRIEYELGLIDQKGYNDYFLVVYDYVKWARNHSILYGCRGSGAGSVVAYILGITTIDPLKWNLIFERFLNPERPSPPDFDIDFQDDKRDLIFHYMSEKYSKENTSFIGTFGRLKTKAAIRDVARVMGIELETADKLSKMVLVKFGKVFPIEKMRHELKEFDDMIKQTPGLEDLAHYVSKLENIARHVSIHACGFLVTPAPITDYVPIQTEPKDAEKTITQVEGAFLEPMGLMKFDFLGLRNLTIIDKTLNLIKSQHNLDVNIYKIPLDDDRTFKIFQIGNTTGVFQFESEGMKKYLRELCPTEIEDLVFLNAAYRPGPMQYIPNYIDRKYGREKVTFLDESIKPILESTYGFAIYQEQVINIAVAFAGYSLGEADVLRRAMGKKKVEVMAKEKEKFIRQAIERSHSKKISEAVFAYLEPFADYGFNRSHAANYSIIAYQTAYLKAHFPIEFMASLLETECEYPDKFSNILKETREMKIDLLPPNINYSFVNFNIEHLSSIRYGFSGAKGAGKKIMQNIVDEREKNGRFNDFDDLIVRVGCENLTKKDLEVLIKVGAMDEFGYRNQLLASLPLIFDKYSKFSKRVLGGQSGLFDIAPNVKNLLEKTTLPNTPKETDSERLLWEKDILGTFVSSHPLDYSNFIYADTTILTIDNVLKLPDKSTFSILGILSRVKIIRTKSSSKQMAFVDLEDKNSKIEGVIFPNAYARIQDKIQEMVPSIFVGSIGYRDDKATAIIEDIILIEEYSNKHPMSINISSETDKFKIENLKNLIAQNPGEIKLEITYGNGGNPKSIYKYINPTKKLVSFIRNYNNDL